MVPSGKGKWIKMGGGIKRRGWKRREDDGAGEAHHLLVIRRWRLWRSRCLARPWCLSFCTHDETNRFSEWLFSELSCVLLHITDRLNNSLHHTLTTTTQLSNVFVLAAIINSFDRRKSNQQPPSNNVRVNLQNDKVNYGTNCYWDTVVKTPVFGNKMNTR